MVASLISGHFYFGYLGHYHFGVTRLKSGVDSYHVYCYPFDYGAFIRFESQSFV